MHIAVYVSLLVAITFVAIYLGAKLPLHLPCLNKRFDRKPFNCRPCLTFHLVWIGFFSCAFATHNLPILVIGIIVAFAVFAITRYIDTKKITK